MHNLYNIFIYKLLVSLKNKNVVTININDLSAVHSDFIKLFKDYNLDNYYDYFKNVNKFVMTFIYVFSDFELGFYKTNKLTFYEDPIIINKLINSEIDINGKLINELAVILFVYLDELNTLDEKKRQ